MSNLILQSTEKAFSYKLRLEAMKRQGQRVVYDRIRENRALMGKKASFEELVNRSVNQSARRTLITTITTVMALGVLCIVAKFYGLDSIFTFAFPLMMGMISGVYTSLCVSTSAWMLWSERSPKSGKKA